eukprot:scaffold3964_cov77-Skeletonema_marinoi.AAC.4
MMTQQSQQHEHEHEDDDTPAGFQIPDRLLTGLLSNSVKPLVFPDTHLQHFHHAESPNAAAFTFNRCRGCAHAGPTQPYHESTASIILPAQY